MNVIRMFQEIWEFNRTRTLGTLDAIAALPNPQKVLGWRPAPGRAHIAWQLVHVGITEELFATERLKSTPAAWPDLVPRFKGGSTPDDNIPELAQIREILTVSREHLIATMDTYSETDLPTIPEWFKERGWTLRRLLEVINWHEGHHQGQAHITLNLYKAAHAST